MLLLEGKSGQIDDEEDDEAEEPEDEEEDEDTEVNTFETLCDLIPRLAKVIRDGFEPSLKQLRTFICYLSTFHDEIHLRQGGCERSHPNRRLILADIQVHSIHGGHGARRLAPTHRIA